MTAWYERAGGYIVSIFLHLMLLSLLVTHIIVDARPIEPPPMEISFEFAAESAVADVADEVVPASFPPPPSAAAGDGEENDMSALTEPEETEQEEAPALDEAFDEPDVEVVPAEEIVEDPGEELAPVEQVEMAQEVQEKLDIDERLRQLRSPSAQEKKLSEIQAKIAAKEVQIKGQDIGKYLPGAQSGAVRTFNLVGAPHIVEAVMQRYEIKIVTRYLSQSEVGGSGYLSQVRTNQDTYANIARTPGNYQVFQYGEKGTRKLQELEIAAIKAEGLDPQKDRLIEIEFGIGVGVDGPDLKVLRLRAEKIRF